MSKRGKHGARASIVTTRQIRLKSTENGRFRRESGNENGNFPVAAPRAGEAIDQRRRFTTIGIVARKYAPEYWTHKLFSHSFALSRALKA
jgi:hypothetical protein